MSGLSALLGFSTGLATSLKEVRPLTPTPTPSPTPNPNPNHDFKVVTFTDTSCDQVYIRPIGDYG